MVEIVGAYHRSPLDRFPETDEESFLAEAVTQHGVCDWREEVEDDGHADEDLPGGDVESVSYTHLTLPTKRIV